MPRINLALAMSRSRDCALSHSLDWVTRPSCKTWCDPVGPSVRAPHRLHTGIRPFVSGAWCSSSWAAICKGSGEVMVLLSPHPSSRTAEGSRWRSRQAGGPFTPLYAKGKSGNRLAQSPALDRVSRPIIPASRCGRCERRREYEPHPHGAWDTNRRPDTSLPWHRCARPPRPLSRRSRFLERPRRCTGHRGR